MLKVSQRIFREIHVMRKNFSQWACSIKKVIHKLQNFLFLLCVLTHTETDFFLFFFFFFFFFHRSSTRGGLSKTKAAACEWDDFGTTVSTYQLKKQLFLAVGGWKFYLIYHFFGSQNSTFWPKRGIVGDTGQYTKACLVELFRATNLWRYRSRNPVTQEKMLRMDQNKIHRQ